MESKPDDLDSLFENDYLEGEISDQQPNKQDFEKENAIFDDLNALENGTINPGIPGEPETVLPEPVPSTRKRATLTNELLVSPNGLPRLYLQSKKLRISKRAGAQANFESILNLYQTWGHSLFPRLEFSSFITRVEKLCHTKRMKIYLDALNNSANDSYDVPNGDFNERDESNQFNSESTKHDDEFGQEPSRFQDEHLAETEDFNSEIVDDSLNDEITT